MTTDQAERGRTTSPSSASAGSARRPPGSSRGAGRRCSGSSSSSSATTAAPRTTRRASCGTAITRPATSRWPFEAYDDWADLEARVRRGARHDHRRARPVPAGRRRSRLADYTSSHGAPSGVRYEVLDIAEVAARWPQLALPDGTVALYQERTGIVHAGRTVDRACSGWPRGRRDARRRAPGDGARDRATTATVAVRRSAGRRTRSTSRSGSSSARTPGPTTLLAPLGLPLPLTVTEEQVTYFAPAEPDALRPGPVPGVDLDGRAVVLRLPDLRRGGNGRGQGGPGLRRSRWSPATSGPATTDGGCSTGCRLHGADASRLGAPVRRSSAASTP